MNISEIQFLKPPVQRLNFVIRIVRLSTGISFHRNTRELRSVKF